MGFWPWIQHSAVIPKHPRIQETERYKREYTAFESSQGQVLPNLCPMSPLDLPLGGNDDSRLRQPLKRPNAIEKEA